MRAHKLRLLGEVLRKYDFDGLDIDFEFIGAQNAYPYAEFIGRARQKLNRYGYEVFAALAPKTDDSQKGVLYEGHLYREIGEAADAVLLMTYEWGYTFGPAMAVSPIPNVRRVIEYAVTEISPDKIILGVPNYGYDWTLPFVEGESRARSIGNEEALRLAKDRRARIRFDDEQRAPTFNYYDIVNGKPIEHEVWFENARSVYETLELVDEFGLEGIGIWNLMRSFTQMWTVINSTYNIKKIL
jgi:spore germination protein